jgi:phage gpG-like protein
MVKLASGLIVSEALTQRNVKVDMHFEPSLGILARRFDTLGRNIRSFREPLRRSVLKVVIPSIRTNFEVGGRPKWRDLTANTLAARKYEGYGPTPILVRSGMLRRVATQLNIWTIDAEKAMITDLPQKAWYGKVHQAGAGATTTFTVTNTSTGIEETFEEEGEGGIPARPFVVLQPDDIDDIEEVFMDWLEEKIAMAGLGSRGTVI